MSAISAKGLRMRSGDRSLSLELVLYIRVPLHSKQFKYSIQNVFVAENLRTVANKYERTQTDSHS